MHGVHKFQFGEGFVRDFQLGQEIRDDAHDGAAFFQRPVGHTAHQAHVAAAVHDIDAIQGQMLAKGVGRLGVNGFFAGVGAAIDNDGFHGKEFVVCPKLTHNSRFALPLCLVSVL